MEKANFTIRVESERGPEELYCDGSNTELYIHSDKYKEVDHIFNRIDQRDRRLGAFIWRHILGDENFNNVAMYMHNSGEFAVFYRPEPTEPDFEHYLKDQSGDIETWNE